MLETLKSFYGEVVSDNMMQAQIDRVCEPLNKMPKSEVIDITRELGLVGSYPTRKAAIKAIKRMMECR